MNPDLSTSNRSRGNPVTSRPWAEDVAPGIALHVEAHDGHESRAQRPTEQPFMASVLTNSSRPGELVGTQPHVDEMPTSFAGTNDHWNSTMAPQSGNPYHGSTETDQLLAPLSPAMLEEQIPDSFLYDDFGVSWANDER